MSNNHECTICGLVCKTQRGLLAHASTKHHITNEEYYLQYFLNGDIPTCANPNCNNHTKFVSSSVGYRKYCCARCSELDNKRRQSQRTEEQKQQSNLKRSKTCQEKYGVSWATQTQQNRISCESSSARQKALDTYKKACLDKYGSTNWYSSDVGMKHVQSVKLEKYGSIGYNGIEKYKDNKTRMATIKEKEIQTKKKNGTLNTSSQELEAGNILSLHYNEVISQYKCDRYPFHCDFYIPTEDLFIECNFHWTHGNHPFNKYSIVDMIKLSRLKLKARESKYHEIAIDVWTRRDVEKLNYLKHLNHLIFYSLSEMKDYFNNRRINCES